MSVCVTNLYLSFDTGGAKPSEVIQRLSGGGFIPQEGSVDMKYIWKKKPTFQEILYLLDTVSSLLIDTKVKYSSETTTEEK